MRVSVLDLIQLRILPTGRRRHVAQRVKSVAAKTVAEKPDEEPDPRLSKVLVACERVISHDQQTAQLEAALAKKERGKQKPKPETASKAVALDRKIDRTLSSIDGVLGQWSTSGFEPNAEEVVDAEGLRDFLFPGGVVNITGRPHVEALPLLQDLLKRVNTREQQITEFGVAPFVSQLSKLAQEFQVALRGEKPGEVTRSDVRAANRRGNALVRALIARILAEFDNELDAQVMAQRRLLLAPILEQDAIMLRYNRQGRTPPDVNPDTGEELPDTGDLLQTGEQPEADD